MIAKNRRLNMFILIMALFPGVIHSQLGWHQQFCPIEDGLHNLYFVNDSLGWVISYGTGILIHTIDAGKNWQIQHQFDSLYFEQIQFIDKNIGWLCGEYGFVFKTFDGGKNWLDVSPPVEQRITTKIDWRAKTRPGGCYIGYYSMHFFDEDTGFVAGQKLSLVENKRAYIYYSTHDGGKSWQLNPGAPNDMAYDPYFLDAQVGFVGGNTNVYLTKNAAHRWTAISSENLATNDQLRSVFFLDQSMGWACGFSGKVFILNHDHSTWDSVQVSNNRLRSICFIDRKHGIVVGDKNQEAGSMFESSDGGKTWEMVPDDFPDLHRIFLTRSSIWIVGKAGMILRRNRNRG